MKPNLTQPTVLLLSLIISYIGCKGPSNTATTVTDESYIEYNNPPAEGFNVEASHPIAILLADQVMNAMGGRARWDSTRYLHWNFFGRRALLWDKDQNRVKVTEKDKNTVTVVNMSDMTGQAWVGQEEVTDQELLKKLLLNARNIWINDAYWLVMPFKLKDSGVTLTYVRDDQSLKGEPCTVLGLFFEAVGVTPENGYEVWVSDETKLVVQWAYYKNAEDEEPKFVLPWEGYQSYDGLLLASDRGEGRTLSDIKVMKSLPKGAFSTYEDLF